MSTLDEIFPEDISYRSIDWLKSRGFKRDSEDIWIKDIAVKDITEGTLAVIVIAFHYDWFADENKWKPQRCWKARCCKKLTKLLMRSGKLRWEPNVDSKCYRTAEEALTELLPSIDKLIEELKQVKED